MDLGLSDGVNLSRPWTYARAVGLPPLAAGFSLLLLASGALLLLLERAEVAQARVERTLEVLETERMVISLVQDAETAQRGYLLTRDAIYLAPYRAATEQLPSNLARLQSIVLAQEQEQRVVTLRRTIEQKLYDLETIVVLVSNGMTNEALAAVRAGAGRRLMDNIRAQAEVFRARSMQLLAERRAIDLRFRHRLHLTTLVILALTAALAVAAMITAKRQIVTLSVNERALLVANEELETRVAQRTVELETARADAQRERDRVNVLLEDVNHRVGNSLQMISSFLTLQSERVTDDSARTALESARSRIQSIASAERRLRLVGAHDRVELDRLLADLITDLRRTIPDHRQIHIAYELQPTIALSRDAVSIAVIVHELVNNALKHAFTNGTAGTITVRLAAEPSGAPAELTIADDGIGTGKALFDSASGLGSHVVKALTTSLGGKLTVELANAAAERPGTRVIIAFAKSLAAEGDRIA